MSKIAIVTGANQGIGYHIAKQLIATGEYKKVILACRRDDAGRQAEIELGSDVSQFMKLDIGDSSSIAAFAASFPYDRLDLLVNNAATAFKAADPTPFNEQARPTIDVNFHGTLNFTNAMLPMLRKSSEPRVVSVASQAGLLKILKSDEKKAFFRNSLADKDLTIPALIAAMNSFVADVERVDKGNAWSDTCYGMSKLGVIAWTKLSHHLETTVGSDPDSGSGSKVAFTAFCPGYCNTSMTSGKGPRPPEEGAACGTWLAGSEEGGLARAGRFFYDSKERSWEE